jgi:outer membrane protein TolC
MKFTTSIFIILLMFGICSAQIETTLSLKDCIQIATDNNSQLKNARRDVDIAQSGIASAYSYILPQVDMALNTGKTYQSEVEYLGDAPVEYEKIQIDIPILDPVTGDTVFIAPFTSSGKPTRYEQVLISQPSYERKANSFQLEVGQNLFDGGIWWNRIRKAKADKMSAEHSADHTKQQIIMTTKQYYYNLLKQQALLKVSEENVRSNEEQFNRTHSMYEIGSVAQADVYKTRVSFGVAKSELIAQKNKVMVSKYNLNFIMGRDPRTSIAIKEIEVDSLPRIFKDREIEQALENSPQLLALKKLALSSELNHKMAKGQFWPAVSVGASYSRFSPEFNRLYEHYEKNYNWYVGASVRMNLFRGFGDKAVKDTQKLYFLTAEENYIERKRQLRAEVEEDYQNLKSYQELIIINEENLVSAEEDLRLARERYRVGSGTLLDVLQAQVSVTQAQTTLINAKYDAMISQAELEAAIGSLSN